jgi:heat shock protein HslJ
MKNVYFPLFALIVSAGLTVGACGATTTSPTSPSAAGGSTALTASDFSGTWQLVDVQRVEQAAQPVPEGATYRITFENGKVSTRADCNVCGGAFTMNGQTITIGPALACTKAACPTMNYESEYEAILSGDHSVVIQGRDLRLSSKRGVLHFTR